MKKAMRKTADLPSSSFASDIGTVLTGDIFDRPSTGLFGHIDSVTPQAGIEGWVLDCAAPDTALEVELLAGDRLIARVPVERRREDIADILKAPCSPGFLIGPEAFDMVRTLEDNFAPMVLRIAGRPAVFDLSGLFSTVGACKRLWVDQRLARLSREDVASAEAAGLLDRLEALSERAGAMAERPLFPLADLKVGRIEAFHSSGAGALWVVGWMRRDLGAEFPLVVVDKRRFPGATAMLHYERADLPSDHVGVIGFVLTHWKPVAGSGDFHLYVDERTNLHLSAAPGLRALSAEELLGQLESVRNVVSGGAMGALRGLLASDGNWLPNNARAVGIAAEAALDKVVLLPGFGAFVEGWAICPTRRPRGFALKIGDCILRSEAQTTYFRERPDLASVFPDGGLYVARAGFGAVLHGPLTTADIGTALLKVIYTEGTSSVHPVDGRVMRRFNADEDSAPLLHQWPALEHEGFFPAFARAVHRDWLGELQPPSPVVMQPARAALVIVLPQSASNMRALFETLSRHLFETEAPESIVFIAARRETRSESLRLVNELARERGVKASLYLMDDERAALTLLPAILGQIGVETFVYVDQGLLLTSRGWVAALAYLKLEVRAPLLLEIVDQHGEPDRVTGARGASCFAWDLSNFSRWLQTAEAYVPGATLDARFCRAVPGISVVENAARRIEIRRSPRLIELVDAALHRQGGE